MSGDINKLCLNCMRYGLNEQGVCSLCGASVAEGPKMPHHLATRTVLNGKYLSARVLGEGGFGITYLGWDINLEVKVAIKEYYPLGAVTRNTTVSDQVTAVAGPTTEFFNQGRERFIDEARRLAKFYSLPGIVSVKDFFLENGTAYIVMEFVEGGNFKDYLEQNGNRLPEATVLEMMKPLIRSLAEVHRAGVIHRDISPDNIMIGPDGQLRLIDFGAARDFQDENKSLSVLLKPGYAPEEQYRSRGKQGPWTDVYALSATIYRAIEGDKPPESMERMFEDSFRGFTVPVSQNTAAALTTGLAVRHENRWQNMEQLYAALYGVSHMPPVTMAPAMQAAPPPPPGAPQAYPVAGQQPAAGQPQPGYGRYAQPAPGYPAAQAYPGQPYAAQPPAQKPKNKGLAIILSAVGVLALALVITLAATRGGGGAPASRSDVFGANSVAGSASVGAVIGESEVHSLNITAAVDETGNALMTEVWEIDIAEGISEWFLAKRKDNSMEISDLEVSENGQNFTIMDEWDIMPDLESDVARERKADTCGILYTDDGYELCWGIGSPGRHTFTVQYRLDNLAQGFSDGIAISNYFVGSMQNSIGEVAIDITCPDLEFEEIDEIWAGSSVEVEWEAATNDHIEITLDEPLPAEAPLGVFIRLDEDTLNPGVYYDESSDAALESMQETLRNYTGTDAGADTDAPEEEAAAAAAAEAAEEETENNPPPGSDDYGPFMEEAPFVMIDNVAVVDGNMYYYQFENISDKTIEYMETWVFCYDDYGNPISGESVGDGIHNMEWTVDRPYLQGGATYDVPLYDETGYYEFSNCPGTVYALPFISYVRFTDGTYWGITDLDLGNNADDAGDDINVASEDDVYYYIQMVKEIYDETVAQTFAELE